MESPTEEHNTSLDIRGESPRDAQEAYVLQILAIRFNSDVGSTNGRPRGYTQHANGLADRSAQPQTIPSGRCRSFDLVRNDPRRGQFLDDWDTWRHVAVKVDRSGSSDQFFLSGPNYLCKCQARERPLLQMVDTKPPGGLA